MSLWVGISSKWSKSRLIAVCGFSTGIETWADVR